MSDRLLGVGCCMNERNRVMKVGSFGNAVVYKTGKFPGCPIHSSQSSLQVYEEMARLVVQNAKRVDMITGKRV